METGCDISVEVPNGPEAFTGLEARLKDALQDLVSWVRDESDGSSLFAFEKALWTRIALLYRLTVALFIAVRRERFGLDHWQAQGWRIKRSFSQRSVRTLCGAVTYGRAYLIRRESGGWFPL